MAKGYLIAEAKVTDAAAYAGYKPLAAAATMTATVARAKKT